MYKVTVGLLIFMTGWGLGWFSHIHWETEPVLSALPVTPTLSKPFTSDEPAADFLPTASSQTNDMLSLLQNDEFSAVLEQYDSLQAQADEVAVADTRTQILSHARQLITERRFSSAEQLLQIFLVAAYRDVEARVLLAEAHHGQEDLNAAIDQLYETKGYAYRPAMLEQISSRIRSIVAELTQSLKHNNDQYALLTLYQHLTQLEPEHAPWFIGLAAAQMALDDTEAARRSLLLISQDPDVGAQAQAILSRIGVALAKPQVSAAGVVGIPLHRSGNHFMVDAKPHQGHSIRLLIDTGASLTILTPYALEQADIRYQKTGRNGVFNTANGPVKAPIYKLDSLSVGDRQVNQLEIGVLDLGGNSGIDGLLGMNFLRHFQFFIDQNEALLRLSVN